MKIGGTFNVRRLQKQLLRKQNFDGKQLGIIEEICRKSAGFSMYKFLLSQFRIYCIWSSILLQE